MPKRIYLPLNKIDLKKPHLRWNYEKSPDMHDALRYHFVIVEDRMERDGVCDKLARNLNSGGKPLEIVRDVEINVQDSRYGGRFVSYDTQASPNLLNLGSLGLPLIKDEFLVERVKKRSSVENYVADKYWR